MMIHGFDMYRVFISAPGDLQMEQDACRAVISDVNEKEAMPRKVLLVSVGLREHGQIEAFRSAIAENVRQSSYYIQVFEDDWGPRNLFRKMFFLATECVGDSNLPMREVVVCLKDAPHEIDAEILAFRTELQEQPNVLVLHFDKVEKLEEQLRNVCQGWVRSIIEAGGGVPG
jgi:hypothetical protein